MGMSRLEQVTVTDCTLRDDFMRMQKHIAETCQYAPDYMQDADWQAFVASVEQASAQLDYWFAKVGTDALVEARKGYIRREEE